MSRIAIFWVLFLVALGFALFAVSDILLPFVAGMALAYFLDPLADKLEERGLGRLTATSVLTFLFSLIVIILALMIVPVILRQAFTFIQKLPEWFSAGISLLNSIPEDGPIVSVLGLEIGGESIIPDRYIQEIEAQLQNLVQGAVSTLGLVLENLWSQGLAFFNLLALMVIMPVVTFYMLRDWDEMVRVIDSWLPPKHAPIIRGEVKKMEAALSGFVRGQSMVCLFLGAFYAIGLSLVGLDFGLLIGIIAGFLAFIPYVGTTVGLISSTGMAALQWWGSDPWSIVIVAIIFGAGQLIEGLILTPRLVGNQAGLHPVWVMFAILAGGSLFGFVGVLIAVPVAAVIAVLVRYALERYLDSEFYHGSDSGYIGFRPPLGSSKDQTVMDEAPSSKSDL